MIPVFDGHNDVLTRPDHGDFVRGRGGGHLDLPRMQQGGIRGAIFAIFTPSPGPESDEPEPVGHAAAAAHATAAAGRLAALDRAGELRLAATTADLDSARQASDSGGAPTAGAPPAAVLHLEGAEAIDEGLEALDLWYSAGLRSLGPVWSRPNVFAHGVPFRFPASPDTGPGLTSAGHRLVRRCAELGILVDLSHLNERGFWDVARLEAGPLVASHSAAHALCASTRNLTDAQLDEIGRTGGLVGIVFSCAFLREDGREDPDTPLELIARHARYVADRIGVEHVGFGSDFDGTTIPAPLGGADGLPRLLEVLREAGFSEPELRDVAWENWRRVLGSWWRE